MMCFRRVTILSKMYMCIAVFLYDLAQSLLTDQMDAVSGRFTWSVGIIDKMHSSETFSLCFIISMSSLN